MFLLATCPLAAQSPPDPTVYMVSYVEVAPAARTAATTALKRYRDMNRTADGHMSIELFEQTDRPGHFVMVETWRDQKGFDAVSGAARKQLTDALRPIRQSGWDDRPYKTLSVGGPNRGNPGAGARGGILVVSHVDVTPDQKIPPLLLKLAEASRQEAGNVRFDVLQHAMRANHFTVVEVWRDQKAYDAHLDAPHTKSYREDLQPALGSPLDERIVRLVE